MPDKEIEIYLLANFYYGRKYDKNYLTLSSTKRGKRPFKSKHIIHSKVQVFGSDFDSRIAQQANKFSALQIIDQNT